MLGDHSVLSPSPIAPPIGLEPPGAASLDTLLRRSAVPMSDTPGDSSALDPQEQVAWRSFRTVLATFSRVLTADLQQHVGLSYFEYEILEALAEAPGSARRLGELADACHASLSTSSRAVSRLEARGLVDRRLDQTDGRYVTCALTEAGEHLLRDGLPGHVRQLRRLVFDALTGTQVQQLTQICDLLGDTLEAERRRGAH